MSNSPASDPFDAAASKLGATGAAPVASARDPFDDAAAKFTATPAASSPPSAPPAAPEKPFDTVTRLQGKIDDGTATNAERSQWLDARTQDLHDTSLPERMARVVTNAPYSKIPGQVGGYLAKTGIDAVKTGATLAAPMFNPSDENIKGAAKAAGSAALGAISEGGAIGKSVIAGAENAKDYLEGAVMNIFHPNSDWAPRVQALQELDTADTLRNIDPGAVKALAPDQAAASTGGAAVDAASALAGPESVEGRAALAAPKNVETIGSEALKAQADAKKLASLQAAAQKAADLAPPGPLKAAGNYGVAALKASAEAVKALPIVGGVAKGAGLAYDAVSNAAKGVGTLAKAAAQSPITQRAAVGGVVGGAANAASAAPGDQPEAFAEGVGGGMMAGAARDPRILSFANGSRPAGPTGITMAQRAPEPPILTTQGVPQPKPAVPAGAPKGEPIGPQAAGAGSVDAALAAPASAKPSVPGSAPKGEPIGPIPAGAGSVDAALAQQAPPRKLTVPAGAPKGEPIGPVPEGAGSADAALAAQPTSKPPLTLATPQPPTQPVSRFSGGTAAVPEVTALAQDGNRSLRSQIVAGEKPVTPEIAKTQEGLSDKPLATVGPAPAPIGPNADAMAVSQALGREISKYENVDRVVNNLIGGNRTGQGTPTQQFRVHEIPDGTKMEVGGEKFTIVRPEGMTDSTIVRFDNPEIPDIHIYNPQPNEAGVNQHVIPTDTGPREIAKLSDEDPNPIMIGGKEHQLLAQPMSKTSAVSLADPENNRKILASRKVLNADKGTIPQRQAPVPMKSVDSRNVHSQGYDAKTQKLYVRFKNGTLYTHDKVPIEVAKAFDEAPSKGTFYNKNIMKAYPLETEPEE